MNKQRKQFILLVVVFVALLAVFFGLKSYNKKQAEIPVEEEPKDVVVEVEKDDIVKLTYDYEGETLSFEKVDDIWYYAEDHSLKITQYLVKSMLAGLSPFEVEDTFENVTDMAQYGLEEPERVISFEANGNTYTVNVGSHNSASKLYYIAFPGENTVYTIESYKIILFDESLEDLIEKPEETTE